MTIIGRDGLLLAVFVGLVAFASTLVFEPSAVIAIAAAPLVAGGIVLIWGVLHGSRIATLLHLFCAAFLMHAVFRVRDYQDKDVDFQVIIKIGLWITVAGVALIHARRWIDILRNPVNLPCALFLIWLFATTLVSPNPTYTAVSAFTIFACVVFSAYMFSIFDMVDVFTTVVLAIMLFCAVSIVVYFVLPEFGHYVYWVNEERFVSPRLAGIAGSANNMALVAAFGLVVTGLYYREFHAMNRLFVPASVLLCGAALLMTNSRAPLAMVCVILLATYAFTWKRLYAGLFLLSVGILLLAVVLPFGQDTLLKAVSRSGDIGEVTSFTGRTEIWYGVLKLVEMQPWMGYGYASSVFVLPQYVNEIGFTTSHAHNLMLQLLLTTGWIGVILFTLAIMGVILRAIVYRDRIAFAMIAFVLLNGITESSGFTTLANICSLAFGIAVSLPLASRHQDDDEDDHSYQRRFS
jgi:exopolysaccharide production protein ExoQ